jgi:F-type H+-transporting ATPase subunit b
VVAASVATAQHQPSRDYPPPSGETAAQHGGHAAAGHAAAGHAAEGAGVEGEKHGEEAEAEEHGPPKPINWMDFDNKEQPPYGAMLLNFVVLMGIYVYFGKKPIAEALKSRRASVAKEIEEAQKMRKEAEERAAKYQEKLQHLEEELKDTRAALVEAGKADRDRIVREAEEKATRMEKDAQFLVEQEMKQLRADLTREAVEIAVAAAEELLMKRVTPVDHERLAEDYLAQLAAKTKTNPSLPPARPSVPPVSGGHS